MSGTPPPPAPPPPRRIGKGKATAPTSDSGMVLDQLWIVPRQVTPLDRTGKPRWACRGCGTSHRWRLDAERCCADRVNHPDQLRGGEIIPAGHRTHEQVVAQLEERMKELEAEAARRKVAPPTPYPCATCKWRGELFDHDCEHPLVKGFETHGQANVDWQLANCTQRRGELSSNWPGTKLCGREKALWEPVAPPPEPPLTRWQHLLRALFG